MTDPTLDARDRHTPEHQMPELQRRSLEASVQRLFRVVRLMFESWLAAAKRDPRIIDRADIESMIHVAAELAREDLLAAEDERRRNQRGG